MFKVSSVGLQDSSRPQSRSKTQHNLVGKLSHINNYAFGHNNKITTFTIKFNESL